MRNRLSVALALALLFLAGRADAQFSVPTEPGLGENYHVELGYTFWSPTPELLIGSDAFSVVGTNTIDFVSEFGIDADRFREFRATVRPGRKHKIRISHVPVHYEQAAQIQRTITFNGRTFPVQAQVDAEVDWNMWRFGYEWDFVARPRGFIGVVGEMKYNTVTASLSGAGLTADVDATAPVPTIGMIFRGYPHRVVSVTGEFTAFRMPDKFRDTLDATFYDFDVYATANLGRNVGAQLGYRSIIAQYVVDEDNGDLKLKGIYFGGMIRF